MPKTRLLIADDHALVRAGLRALLAARADMDVVGEAGDGVEVVEQCRRLAPDVVLMDLTMPGRNGIGAIQDLRQTCPETRVLVVTMHEDEAYARQAMLAGATGYVLKKSLAADLITAIQTVRQGRQYIAPSLAAALAQMDAAAAPAAAEGRVLELLTEREREVVIEIALLPSCLWPSMGPACRLCLRSWRAVRANSPTARPRPARSSWAVSLAKPLWTRRAGRNATTSPPATWPALKRPLISWCGGARKPCGAAWRRPARLGAAGPLKGREAAFEEGADLSDLAQGRLARQGGLAGQDRAGVHGWGESL
jgi:two-component system, NarL family, response regulator NreC